MIKDNPLVSIGMPIRNCENTLPFAICSILNQTYENWELILVDDGSSDQTVKIAEGFEDSRIQIWSDGKNFGIAHRLNQAIRMSKGKYFARMDGDDISYPKRFEKQIEYLESHPYVDLVGAWILVIDGKGFPLGKRTPPEFHKDIVAKPFAGFPLAHPTYVGRVEWFIRYLYNKSAIRCEDQELLLRSYRSSGFANIPEILLAYREEAIDIKKILKSRLYFGICLYKEYKAQRNYSYSILGLGGQVIKALIDYLAVKSNLNYKMLRHRALPIRKEEFYKWEKVKKTVDESVIEVRKNNLIGN